MSTVIVQDPSTSNPFSGQIQGALLPQNTTFLMLYYLPPGGTNASITSTGGTYYIAWREPETFVPVASGAFGVLNYLSSDKGRPYAFSYKQSGSGFNFGARTISNYATTGSSIDQVYFSMSQAAIPSISDSVSWTIDSVPDLANIYDGSTFQLQQINTNVPSDQIYSGVWYYMMQNGEHVIPPAFDLPSPNLGSFPFPNNTSQTINYTSGSYLQTPWVMFLPYTQDLSYWVGGYCQNSASLNIGMSLVSDWIITKYSQDKNTSYTSLFSQKQCYANLGPHSSYCAYIGAGCNGSFGYNYCGINSSCGKCFGSCGGSKQGLNCTWDSNGSSEAFYCSTAQSGTGTNVDPGAEANASFGGANRSKQSSHWSLALIIGILVVLLLVMVLFYMVGHRQDHKYHKVHKSRGDLTDFASLASTLDLNFL